MNSSISEIIEKKKKEYVSRQNELASIEEKFRAESVKVEETKAYLNKDRREELERIDQIRSLVNSLDKARNEFTSINFDAIEKKVNSEYDADILEWDTKLEKKYSGLIENVDHIFVDSSNTFDDIHKMVEEDRELNPIPREQVQEFANYVNSFEKKDEEEEIEHSEIAENRETQEQDIEEFKNVDAVEKELQANDFNQFLNSEEGQNVVASIEPVETPVEDSTVDIVDVEEKVPVVHDELNAEAPVEPIVQVNMEATPLEEVEAPIELTSEETAPVEETNQNENSEIEVVTNEFAPAEQTVEVAPIEQTVSETVAPAVDGTEVETSEPIQVVNVEPYVEKTQEAAPVEVTQSVETPAAQNPDVFLGSIPQELFTPETPVAPEVNVESEVNTVNPDQVFGAPVDLSQVEDNGFSRGLRTNQ